MNQTIISYDPSNGNKLGELQTANKEQINDIVRKAKVAAVKWKHLTLDDRLATIQKAYSTAESSLHSLAELLSREMGKDIGRSTGEVQGTIWGGPFMANSALEALRSKNTGGATIEYGPLGVAAIISPWNYPLAMANNLMIPALMAGNSVIWKPSEETPLIAQAFFDIIHKGFPQDLLQIVLGNGEQGLLLMIFNYQ